LKNKFSLVRKSATVFLIGTLLSLGLSGCVSVMGLVQPEVSPIIEAGEMISIMKNAFPSTREGKSLFITTGRYILFDLASYKMTLSAIYDEGNIPDCPFKAATVYIGELHQRLDGSVAAGYAMSNGPIAWFLIFLTNDCGQMRIWGFDPLSDPMSGIWEITTDTDVSMILI